MTNLLNRASLPSRAVTLLAMGLAIASEHSVAADKSGSARAPGKKPNESSTTAPDKSVETLAKQSRDSVVLVTHHGRDGKQDGVGSGFVISPDGLIATCLHVIGESRPIHIQLADGTRYEATEVHAWDRKLDLAIVRISAKNLPALRLGDSDSLRQGREVVAIGHPLGLEHSIVQGVVSARRDFEGVEMIQIAIPIEPGNSGGPLLDLQGRVHGVLMLKSAMTDNLGFAMPVNELKRLLDKPNPVPLQRWLTIGALNPREWTPLLGARWSQKAGRILVEGTGDGFGGRSLCLSHRPVPERPFELSVAVKLEDESGAAGLIFGADDENRHYGFYPTAGQLRLTRFDGPNVLSWTILQTSPSPHYRHGDWNRIKMRWEPDKIRCFVNDQLVIESNDRSFTTGKVGLAKFRDTKAEFRDFRLTTGGPEPAPSSAPKLPTELARKLEDASPPWKDSLLAELQEHPEAAQAALKERARSLERNATQLRQAAALVHRRAVEKELTTVLSRPEEKIDLLHAALLVARLDDPHLDIEPYRRQVDAMAREIAAGLPASADDSARLRALRKYLFEENGFHGSRTDYYNRANSYLHQVLDDREGLPITLSVLFLELARRIDVNNVSGLPLPGHFMVRHSSKDGAEQIIDVFDGGKVINRTEAQERVISATGEGFASGDVRAATKGEIVIRMLRNLYGLAERNDAVEDLLRYLDVILALEPDNARDRSQRARLHLRNGDTSSAKRDLKWLLDHAPPSVDLERVEELYRAL
jgi:S1-C subfamily serine protease/regulator of sirC expression with transglutaminase-like and TPR domain